MSRGQLTYVLLGLLVLSPARLLAIADLPVVQLTAQAGRFLDHDNFFGGLLLRELQRQAVLISAREELGLGTRDMVLREPFIPHNTGGATTVLFESRIWRDDTAQICLSRFDGNQPTDPYALADRRVDDPKNSCLQWASFRNPKGPTGDYAEFTTRCESASRGAFLQALLAENVLGSYQANPTAWVPAGVVAVANPLALQRLQHLDVFSQYLAVRLLHQQIRSDGASTDRLTALVRGYANLGALTHEQWSRADKVFLARALLYAQRLVIHEIASPASLYARAYARSFTGLHAAALGDIEAAATKRGKGDVTPPWLGLIDAMCRYDSIPMENFITDGPWQCRQLAMFAAARVASDQFPVAQFQQVIDRAVTNYPGMFLLADDTVDTGDAANTRLSDQVINQVPVVVSEVLRTADLPASANYAVRHLAPGDESFKELAAVRDRLNGAATKIPLDTTEPSLGVLADLIEQQEMLAIAHHAMNSRSGGVSADIQKLASNAMPILKVHPWGSFIDALGFAGNEEAQLTKSLNKIRDRDRDPGPWTDDALNHIDSIPAAFTNQAKTLRDIARVTTDSLVYDYTAGSDEPALRRLCKTSPHSATLLDAWIKDMPPDRVEQEKPLYLSTLERIETEFSNRPELVVDACGWCNTRGDFDRSLKLLLAVDKLEPSYDICTRLSRLTRRLGQHDESVAQLMRAVKLASDPNETTTAYQQATVDLIEDHRYDEALACVEMSAETPSARVWQLMARCYEAMGQLDDADECLRQQSVADPPSIAQHYMWAKRLNRRNAKELHQKAAAVFAQSTEFMPEYFFAMANDQEPKALDVLRRYQSSIDDAFGLAELVIIATLHHEPKLADIALNAMPGVATNPSFGAAFKALAQSKNTSAGIAGFDLWVSRQLYDEDAVDWYSLAGRYLVVTGHANEGQSYLIRALRLPAHEKGSYFLAWRELVKLGKNPQTLMASPATQQ